MIAWMAGLALGVAHADEVEADYLACRDGEKALAYVTAYEACARCAERGATGQRGPFCAGRVGWIDDRRDADGGVEGLTALQAVRRDFRDLPPDEARARVEAVYEAAAPGSGLYGEAGLWLARASGEPLRYSEPLWVNRGGYPVEVDRQVVEVHATALAEAGRVDEARQVEAAIRIETDAPRPTRVDRVVRRRTRGWVAGGMGAGVGIAAVVGIPLAVVGWRRRRPAPCGLVPLGILTLGSALIAHLYAAAGLPVLAMGAVWAVLHLLSATATPALEGRHTAWKIGFGGLVAWATVGTGYLVLWWVDRLGDVGL